MISARPTVFAILALVGAPAAQEQGNDQQLLDLLDRLPSTDRDEWPATLRSLGDAWLYVTDESAIHRARDQLGTWSKEGLFNPKPGTAASLTRYELVRTVGRLEVAVRLANAADPAAVASRVLVSSLAAYELMRAERAKALQVLSRISQRHSNYSLRQLQLDYVISRQSRLTATFRAEAAAEWLERHGESGGEWVPVVADFLVEEDVAPVSINVVKTLEGEFLWKDETRFALSRCVDRLGADLEDRAIALIHLLHAPETAERVMAIYTFAGLPGFTQAKVLHFRSLLRSKEPMVLREAITALALLGAEAESAVPQLEELAEHEERQIAARAAAALRQIRRLPEPFQGPL
jgi:hypothetical protein